MSKETRELIVGLDIGTSKIVAIVAELTPEGQMAILGIGSHESKGLKKGVVVNIEATVNAISRAIQEVELMSGSKVKSVFTGIAGSHIKSKDSNGMAVVREKEVTQFDVLRAIEAAEATPISSDDKLLHTLVQEFIVDGQDGVKEPIGMDAKRLEVRVHIVTGAVTSVQNIVKCVHRCGLEVADLVLQPLASGHAGGILTLDVAAGDAGIYLAYLAARHHFDFGDGLRYRMHGGLDVDHHAALQTAGFLGAQAKYAQPPFAIQFADDGDDLRGADVKADDQVTFCFFAHQLLLALKANPLG